MTLKINFALIRFLKSGSIVNLLQNFQIPVPTKPQLSEDLLMPDSESVPSRATDVPSTLKDSGYGDVANFSSRNDTPDDDLHLKPRSLLKTITDDLEEDQVSDRPKSAVRIHDRPELINTDLPPDFMASR